MDFAQAGGMIKRTLIVYCKIYQFLFRLDDRKTVIASFELRHGLQWPRSDRFGGPLQHFPRRVFVAVRQFSPATTTSLSAT
jgi:hypothetical protein